MDYVQMTLDDWVSLKKEIAEEFARASASFVRIGYLLRKAEDSQGYRNEGYDTLTEWAQAELGITATYVSRFKAINAKYSVDGYSDRLRTEFVGFGSAKLGEMRFIPTCVGQMDRQVIVNSTEHGSSPHAWGRWLFSSPVSRFSAVHPHMRGADASGSLSGRMSVRFIPTCVGQLV